GSAVAKATKADLTLHWAECLLLGTAGVGTVTFSTERIASDFAGDILKVLDASGWQKDDDDVLGASYADYKAFIWQDDAGNWSFSVETMEGEPITGNYVDNISAAKREAASQLATLTAS